MKAKRKFEEFENEQVTLSMERTVLSKERTVLTEITVLLGFMALGFLVMRFFEDSQNKEFVGVGFSLVIFSAFLMILAIVRYKKYMNELKKIEKKNHMKLPE